jgi:hypothetical protein
MTNAHFVDEAMITFSLEMAIFSQQFSFWEAWKPVL